MCKQVSQQGLSHEHNRGVGETGARIEGAFNAMFLGRSGCVDHFSCCSRDRAWTILESALAPKHTLPCANNVESTTSTAARDVSFRSFQDSVVLCYFRRLFSGLAGVLLSQKPILSMGGGRRGETWVPHLFVPVVTFVLVFIFIFYFCCCFPFPDGELDFTNMIFCCC